MQVPVLGVLCSFPLLYMFRSYPYDQEIKEVVYGITSLNGFRNVAVSKNVAHVPLYPRTSSVFLSLNVSSAKSDSISFSTFTPKTQFLCDSMG